MKKSLYILALTAALALSGCGRASESPSELSSDSGSVSELPPPESGGQTEEAPPETAEPSREITAETEESAGENPYVDENGLLTREGAERVAAIAEEHGSPSSADYTGLFDFDRDGVPEVYLVRHNGGQGLMPVDIFSLDGAEMGGFEGYCRDGFCRLSYGRDGDNCVYVHNSYEHSAHIKHDSVYRLTVTDGRLVSEQYLLSSGAAGDNFPRLEFSYKVNGGDADAEEYFTAYNRWLWENEDYKAREANEVSICAADSRNAPNDIGGMCEWTAELYNEYISGKNTIRERLGETSEGGGGHIFVVPMTYSFDDYDGDGSYEAFVVADFMGETYFLKDSELTEFNKYVFGGATDCTRYGGLLMINGFGNSATCAVYGVSEGAPYEHEASYCGMLIRPSPDYGFDPVYRENSIFALYHTEYNGLNWGDSNTGAHTWTPYPFSFNETDYSWGELPSIPVDRGYFADRADVQSAFDEIEAAGGALTTAFLRGGRYLNINYTTPLSGFDGEEPPELPRENHYRTFLIQNGVTLIDEGLGIYYESVTRYPAVARADR